MRHTQNSAQRATANTLQNAQMMEKLLASVGIGTSNCSTTDSMRTCEIQSCHSVGLEQINCVFPLVQFHPFWIPDPFSTSIWSIFKDTKNQSISLS